MTFRPRSGGSQGFSLGPMGFLIIANLIMWLATSIRSDLFVTLFGLSRAGLLSHPWSVLTAMFIHAPYPDIWHLLGNMLTLFFFGGFLIDLVGESKFFLVYFVGGLLGNVVFLLLAPAYATVIGASGAVFAVGGALTVLTPNTRVLLFGIVPIPLWVAVIGGFFIISANVAWQAHLGGLAFGLLSGWYFRRNPRYY